MVVTKPINSCRGRTSFDHFTYSVQIRIFNKFNRNQEKYYSAVYSINTSNICHLLRPTANLFKFSETYTLCWHQNTQQFAM